MPLTAPMKYLQNSGSYMTPSTGMTNIQSFGQGTPNGLSGTSSPTMKGTDPDDKLAVGYRRVANDLNPTNKIMFEKPKRRWRKRREELKYLKKTA